MRSDPAELVGAELTRLNDGGALGVAVSGGGDSTALFLIAADWARQNGLEVRAATVDHGLRPESGAEAAGVAALCARMGVAHETLSWTDWDGGGNLQAAARDARRRLLADWAEGAGLGGVLLGHTMDDQAETVLMRLGRGSGVDGLSGMRPLTESGGVRWLRPMLGARRSDLRAWLVAKGEEWVDDPSNEDERFARIRSRRALENLGDIGVDAPGLAATADRLNDARQALDHAAGALAADAANWGRCGELYLSLPKLRAAPVELRRRLLRAGLISASGAEYGPRADAEQKLMSAMLSLKLGGGRSLHGCLIRPMGADRVVITREASAVGADRGGLWDGRFEIAQTAPTDGATLGPVGEMGAAKLAMLAANGDWTAPPDWLAAPRSARLTTPALWRGEALIAAPVAAYGDALTARFAAPRSWWASGAPATL